MLQTVGGIVHLSATPGKGNSPGRGYRLERTVDVTRTCVIRGHGGSPNFPGSTVVCDPGVTAFRVWGQGASNGNGAPDTVFEDLTVLAAGRNTNTTTGNYVAHSPTLTLTLDGGDTSLNPCVISHADSGFDLLNTFCLDRVTVGDGSGHHFQGAGFTARGSHANVPATNCNVSSLSNCGSFSNRHALYVNGADANGCRFNVRSVHAGH